MNRGALMDHLPSQKTPARPDKNPDRDPLMRAFKGIGFEKATRRDGRRMRGTALIAAGKEHREDKSVRRDDNPEAPTIRVVNRHDTKYMPKTEEANR